MYLQYFGLDKTPFSLTPDPRFLFLTARHREALAALIFGVTERKGFLVMTGEAGTGKTTLIRKLLSSFPNGSVQFCVVTNPTLTRAELFESILMDFGVKDVPSSKALRLALFKDKLATSDQSGMITVLVIDEAHLLGAELIEEIRLLSNFETSERKLLQIVLAGQQQLDTLLNLPSMTQVKQRVAIRMHLDPLSRPEVDRYLRTRWARASGGNLPPFRPEAIETIFEFSGGIPRLVNVICDAALVNAYGAGKKEIASEDLAEVTSDLQLTPKHPTSSSSGSPARASSGAAKDLESVVPSAAEPAPIRRYMPEKFRQRKLLKVSTWFRSVPTGVE
jgi:general secretion pathway protein A